MAYQKRHLTDTATREPDRTSAATRDSAFYSAKVFSSLGKITQGALTNPLGPDDAPFNLMTASHDDVLYGVDGRTGEFSYVSPAFERLLGYTSQDIVRLGGRKKFLSRVIQNGQFEIQRRVFKQIQAAQDAHPLKRWESWWRCKNGALKCIEDHWIPVYAGGRLRDSFGVLVDITERKQTEQLLQRANRTLAAIRDCHEAMLRAKEQGDLLKEICRIIVETGGERMAWVGYAENDARKTVRPVARAGVDKDYLANARISWADKLHGRGPVGTSIRTGKVCLCHNTLMDPAFRPWRAVARRLGFGSVIALPLKEDDRCYGALIIYDGKPGAFDAAEQHLLTDLANDLAFGINTLRLRAERERLENEILKSIEREQERIGRDLHDGLCQLLVGAKFRSGYLKKITRGRLPEAAREARELETILNKSIEQSRGMARGLNPVKVTPTGLNMALKKLADDVREGGGPHCFFRASHSVRIADHHTANHLYRIAQEAVQNTLKHARAKNIFITLLKEGRRVILAVKDDGAGIPERGRKTGMGLNNMRMRAGLIGGQLEIRRRQKGGTAVTCKTNGI